MIVNSEETWKEFQEAFNANDLIIICGAAFLIRAMEHTCITINGTERHMREVRLIEVVPTNLER